MAKEETIEEVETIEDKIVVPINNGKCRLVISYMKNPSSMIDHPITNGGNKLNDLLSIINGNSILPRLREHPYNFVKQVAMLDDPVVIVCKMEDNKEMFVKFLKSHPSLEQVMSLFVIFKKLYSCNFNNQLLIILSTTLCSEFLKHLKDIIERINESFLADLDEEMEEFIESLTTYLQTLTVDLVPKSLHSSFKSLVTMVGERLNDAILVAKNIGKDIDFFLDTKMNIEAIHAKLDDCNRFEETKIEHLSVMPLNFMHPIWVEPNVIRGPYRDVNHYLVTQFKLLKEDFEESLREDILQCRKDSDLLRNSGQVYKYVTVSVVKSSWKNGHILTFTDACRFVGISWKTTKIFMTGSLLVLSNDGFNKCYLAIVKDRHLLEVSLRNLHVSFLSNSPPYSSRPFVLFEANTFYTPYYQVLNALKNLPSNNFPMHKYIVCADTLPRLPAYLYRDAVYEICGNKVRICENECWPSPAALQLNESQMHALRMVLTSEFSLIQGPPGTGKTYVCLQIIETLLNNVEFCRNKSSPILVVCQRNRALDQILGKLVKDKVKVLRFGGQSKIAELKEEFNVKSVFNIRVGGIRTLNKTIRSLNVTLSNIQKNIVRCYNIAASSERREGIIQLSLLQDVAPNHFTKVNHFLMWLFNDTPEIEMVKIVNLCAQNKQDIKMGKLNVVNKPEVPENDFNLQILNICDTFEETSTTYVYRESNYVLSLYDLETSMKVLRQSIYFKCCNELNMDFSSEIINEMNLFNNCLTVYLKFKERISDNTIFNKSLISGTSDIHSLTTKQRWQLYNCWEENLHLYYQKQSEDLQKKYDHIKIRFDELSKIRRVKKIQKYCPQVIGATTAGAARNQFILTELRPKIVVFEESAEILEAHTVAALSKHCQHAILIGDHKQLRPNPSSYRLAKHFNLDISLFERMVDNGASTTTLTVQHRMRPEISSLISPSIYPILTNGKDVYRFPNILGMDKNVYFIEHNTMEDESESFSKMNRFEGNFLLQVCIYLLHQGYKPQDITILATYSAQSQYIQSECKNLGIENIEITVVDNFQGHESKIVLLSLVRCNAASQIGFLSTENRVCVALSRAKEGLFMIGNMSSLATKSRMWSTINNVLVNQQCIGVELPLKCQIHGNVALKSIEAVLNGLEEVCGQVCNTQLNCGHICTKFCHARDAQHKTVFKCELPCERQCENGHRCKVYCGDSCPPCNEPTDFPLDCGHSVKIPCFKTKTQKEDSADSLEECIDAFIGLKLLDAEEDVEDEYTIPACKQLCGFKLKCGHTCNKKCHIHQDPEHLVHVCKEKCKLINTSCQLAHRCVRKCYEDCGPCIHPVKIALACGHSVQEECSSKVVVRKCHHRCTKILGCGHPCKQLCGEPCAPCDEMVKKKINACGHNIIAKCSEEVRHSSCVKPCTRVLKCGHKCQEKCSMQCGSVPCKTLVLITNPICGHECRMPCHVTEKKGEMTWKEIFCCYCKKPCGAKLVCGHICTGTCGECKQGKLHKKCTSQCRLTLLCGHRCAASCSDDKHICYQSCQFQCRHGKCRGPCGSNCKIRCRINCGRRCAHFRCERKCFEGCDKKCNQECPGKLPCGHTCRGFCGYKCPSVCSECGTLPKGDSKDFRYVVLEDCGHILGMNPRDVIEETTKRKIGIKLCPRCETPIIRTLFFKEKVLQTFQLLPKIRQELLKSEDFSEIRYSLNHNIQLLQREINRVGYPEVADIFKFIVNCSTPFLMGKSHLGKTSLRSLYFSVKFVIIIIEHLKKFEDKLVPKLERNVIRARVKFIIENLKERALGLSTEEMHQFRIELGKLIDVLSVYKRILGTTSGFPSKTFQQVKLDLQYVGDLEDTIYSTVARSSSRRNCFPIVKMKDILSHFDVPEIFVDKSMHSDEWAFCKNGHAYYTSLPCPSCPE